MTASATDNVGATRVEFYVDGVLRRTDTTDPCGYIWEMAAARFGPHPRCA